MHRELRFSTLDEWLAWFETLHPKQIDMSLNRIRSVLESLELAVPPYRVVTVGGTNGKGSCVAYLESIYSAAGYKVGAFVSPHLWRFNERIRIDGRWARDSELVELFAAIERALGSVTLSYFESSAVAAFLHFARRDVDVAILEVGMGGRLDAVNVYSADAGLIASIGMDHEEWLGHDRELIGHEKAGIMRQGRPIVVADRDPPRSIGAACALVGAVPSWIGRDFDIEPTHVGWRYFDRDGEVIELPKPNFGGSEQLTNLAACVRIVRCLHDIVPVSDSALRAGVSSARLPGRLDRRSIDGVDWLFDVAHNPAAAEKLVAYLTELPAPSRSIAVFGVMRDKDIPTLVRMFSEFVDEWFVSPVDSPRSATAQQIADILSEANAGRVNVCADVESACRSARAVARVGDRVLVFGSFYVVGPVMTQLGLYCEPSSNA